MIKENIPPGKPCGHPGCLAHLSHPCEGCGRIGGREFKALIFKVGEGEYDDWIVGVFLVPIEFKESAERDHFYNSLRNNGAFKFKKNGKPYQKDMLRFEEMYFESLKKQFPFLPFEEAFSNQ